MSMYGRRTITVGCVAPKRPAIERWREGYVVQGDCWIWTGYRDPKGYARFRDDEGRKVCVHRFAYEAMRGQIPQGLVLDHLCRSPGCCNPDHLEPVTNAVNVQRGLRGRLRLIPDSCRKGHPYPENARFDRHGRRSCKECSRASGRKYDASRRAQVQR
jgi:hypothetical protein